MSECLREISQCLAAPAGLLGIQPKMVCVAEHALENESSLFQSRLIQPSRASQRFNQPEGTESPGEISLSVTVIF
jgi:hypothetical protein